MTDGFVIVPRPDPVKLLIERFPEIKGDLQEEDLLSLPYPAYGWFTSYLLQFEESSPMWERALHFFNEMAEMSDSEIHNILQVEAFERLAEEPARSRRVKEHLTQRCRTIFEEIEFRLYGRNT